MTKQATFRPAPKLTTQRLKVTEPNKTECLADPRTLQLPIATAIWQDERFVAICLGKASLDTQRAWEQAAGRLAHYLF